MINMIVAMDKNMGIGKDNKLPWKLSNDMKFFKSTTIGSTIVMGRKTYQSIGRLLPDRNNVILTRDKDFKVEGAIIFNDIDSLVEFCRTQETVFVIGGSEVYSQLLPYTEKIYVTIIDHEYDCDAFFNFGTFDFKSCIVLEEHIEDGIRYTINVFAK